MDGSYEVLLLILSFHSSVRIINYFQMVLLCCVCVCQLIRESKSTVIHLILREAYSLLVRNN